MDEMNQGSYFDKYWQSVNRWLKVENVRHKAVAIEFGLRTAKDLNGAAMIGDLMSALDGPDWGAPISPSEENWRWRDSLSERNPQESGEVELERRVVALGGPQLWTYQMPTCSGLHGPHSGRRRSIDLVRRHEAGHYSFIELKTADATPVYAAFEILGYGLAYLQSRLHSVYKTGQRPEVLDAACVNLIVLGPADWYRHGPSGSPKIGFELGRLESAIESGLISMLSEPGPKPMVDIRFRFESFASSEDLDSAAREIVGRV